MAHDWFTVRQANQANRQALSGAGVIDPTVSRVESTSTGAAESQTLADGAVDGHEITVMHVVDGGDIDVTPANFLGGTQVNLLAAGDACKLQWNAAAGAWICTALGGGATIT